MILLYLMLIISIITSSLADRNTLPVFMIDQDQAMSQIVMDPNPFDKMSTPKFADIIHASIKNSEGLIIFIEENFSVEDISIKDKKGTPYVHLRQSVQDNKAKYFPAVIEPYKLLTQIFPLQHYNVFYIKSHTKLKLVRSFKYIYIFFQDGQNETRIDVLRRHDSIIREVCSLIRQTMKGPIVAFYTGKENPVEVKKLHFVPIKPIPVPKDLSVMIASSGALFRFSGVYAATFARRALFNQLPTISDESWSQYSLSTRMAYTDFELEFHFTFRDDGWILDSVGLLEAGEEVGRTEMRVGAPWNMSYVCGEPLVIVNTRDGSTVSISQYQIQPRMTKLRQDANAEPDDDTNPSEAPPSTPGESKDNFGKSKHCGPYFNITILSALLVTFLCLGILSFGLIFIMNVNSNNRYEDPMSKPLVHPES